MKYMVMECHEGYAVLMDEDSRFIHAANLHYKVGDTVTEPVILNDLAPASQGIKMYVTRVAAAAACIAVLIGGGYSYYANNFKPHSTIIISSEANITMELNKKGKVLSLKSTSDTGKEILKDYDGKGKDKSTVARELLEIEKSRGFISDGDTVEVYVVSDDDNTVNNCISDIKQEISEPEINITVKDIKDYDKPAVTAPTAPVEPKEPVAPPEPVKPPTHEAAEPAPEVKLPDEKITAPTAPTAKEPVEKITPERRNEQRNNNRKPEAVKPAEPVSPVEPPTPPAEIPEPEKPAKVTPPEPEKPVEAVPPTAPVEEKKVEPPHPEHEAHEREERNNIHKPHEGLHQSANPIPDNNLIEDVSPDLIGQ